MNHLLPFAFPFLLASSTLHSQENCLHFDGSNDQVNLGANLIIHNLSIFTIEGWVNVEGLPNAQHPIYGEYRTSSEFVRNYIAILPNGKVFFDQYPNTGGDLVSSTALSLDTWTHVAYVQSPPDRWLYINGVLDVSDANSEVYTGNPPDHAQIGRRGGTATSHRFFGKMDELRFWSVARTQAEILAAMNNSVSPTSTGLISYYQFDQGTTGGNNSGITTLDDAASNNYDGTLANFALNGSTSNWVESLTFLPVELTRFGAEEEHGKVILSWETASEQDNAFFEIEHGTSRTAFSPIGEVAGKGTTIERQRYRFVHEHPPAGVNYYRLRQVDSDGQFERSPVVAVEVGVKEVCIFPNPAGDFVQIRLPQGESAQVRVFDAAGRLRLAARLDEGGGLLDVSGLNSGLHVVEIAADGFAAKERFCKK